MTRPFFLSGSVCLFVLAAIACGGSDSTDTSNTGTPGGTSGSSSTGTGGKSGDGGKGGTAAGTGGSGGSTAGQSGAGGSSGAQGGTSAGTSGAGVGGTGTGGAGSGGSSAGQSGTAGTAGVGGASGVSGSSGTAGNTGGTAGAGGTGGNPLCPSALPEPGTKCAEEGLDCTYGMCCPSLATCSGGTWQVAVPKCAPPIQCPDAEPKDGETCNPCFNDTCTYDKCSKAGTNATAVCLPSGKWKVSPQGCTTVKCGGSACQSGEICLATAGGAGISYSCVKDPCFPTKLGCACAKDALCGSDMFSCSEPAPDTIQCSCKLCP